MLNLFGGNKKKAVAKKAEASAKPNFNRIQVVSKPAILNSLLKGLREDNITAHVSRIKLKAASLVSGRGDATIHTYSMYKFKSGPKPVLVMTMPRSTKGGNFVPADMPLEAGEAIEFSYSLALSEADGNTLYFTAKATYVQTALFIANLDDPTKPWVGSRDATEKKYGEAGVNKGEEVLQVRVDQVTVFPNPPESFTADQLSPYLFSPELHVLGGGGVWAKRGGNGYFEGIPDMLDKYIEKIEEKKVIKPVTLIEFGIDEISMFVSINPLTDIDHDFLAPSVLRKPNDNLQKINTALGFLLKFEVADEIKELLMRTCGAKIGKEAEVWLPLTLGQMTDAEPGKLRLLFQIFPRDLMQETNPTRRKKFPGIKFVPPFTLHPNPEDHNTYRKMMVAIGQRMKDDSRPDEEKNKLASVQDSIKSRRKETKGKYVDENLKKAFSKRREAKKREEMQG
ncbi:MAG: hypothetical protein HOH77_04430 [Candidatus Latescibacteria bacterium]|jgi:hypothetical protein|nr:hypothetical protein [Candidatus Latescibacterota bacterium]